MKFIADLHIHSHYSRATSRNLDLPNLELWARIKGVQVLGTGDVTHPGWLDEIKEQLVPAEPGFFRLKKEYRLNYPQKGENPEFPVRFMLSGEISNVYKKGGKVRKIHNLVFFPSLESARKFSERLARISNVRSDGRPILGLDSKILLAIMLECSENAYLIPAHIWTPWFSLLGSKSGFDTPEECFEDLTNHIFAVETGLSSDPLMNWRVSSLDRYTLISNSDAHSPQKIAREANVFSTDFSYLAIFEALKNGDPEKFLGTLEFFPQKGKYHFDGHRKCRVRLAPEETEKANGLCPVCGRKVTVGVMNRVNALADRKPGEKRPGRAHSFRYIIPLIEIIGEVENLAPTSKRVREIYDRLVYNLGPELFIIQEESLEKIEKLSSDILAEAVRRARCGEVKIKEGYDGEFGSIELFTPEEKNEFRPPAI